MYEAELLPHLMLIMIEIMMLIMIEIMLLIMIMRQSSLTFVVLHLASIFSRSCCSGDLCSAQM